jgi:hypothetical protein
MFHDLDDALRKLLSDPAMAAASMVPPLNELLGAEKSFVTPDKDFGAALTGPTVSLFLYEVKEDRALRDPTPRLERSASGFVRRPPLLRVDCCYLVTAWATAGGAVRVRDEHRLLGETLLWLSRFPIVPDVYLVGGGLQDSEYAPPTMVAQTHDETNMGQFWTALGTPPRPAFDLTVTIALDLGVSEEGPLVTTRSSDVHPAVGAPPERLTQIGGRVVSAAGAAVADAVVDLLDLDRRTTSAADGRFTFPRVSVGSHTIRVVATGFQPRTQPLVVPGVPEVYDVTLNPL